MKNFGSHFAIIGISSLLGFIALWPPADKLKAGIDLSGGTILVYEVREENLPSDFKIEELISALKRRINPEGVLDIPIRKVGGGNRLEIILPKASPEDVDEIKRKMTDVGSLEFRILANRRHDEKVYRRALDAAGLSKPPVGYLWAKLGEIVTGTNPDSGPGGLELTDRKHRWSKDAYGGYEVELTGKTAAGTEQTVSIPIAGNTSNVLKLARPHTFTSISSYRININPSEIPTPSPTSQSSEDPLIREETIAPGRVERYILCKQDRQNVTGQYLARVYLTEDDKLQPAVGFNFDRQGARKFGALTGAHLPEEGGNYKYQLAILLDGVVRSAPSINARITSNGIIEFGRRGNSKEVPRLIEILQSGKLPATLNPEPLQQESIGPTLGEDTIAKGITAIEVSMLVVPIFMLVYYRFGGIVAVVALALNMLLLIGSMAFFQASFTLPGLAGLSLTIGMAVDANVLIFERMREEAERGATMAQQIRNGFSKAWLTIFDANVTTMLSGFVLYAIGTDEVKGFALTLIIGLIWNLFTAVYVSRVIFEFWYSRGWLRKMTMMKLMDKTNIDFIAPRKTFMTASMIVILLGLTAFFIRGKSMFNIDFTGGTLVTIRLDEAEPRVQPLSLSERSSFVRQTAAGLPDVTVESLNVTGEKPGLRFNIRTTEQDRDKVRIGVLDAFGTSLQRVLMTVGAAKPIVSEPADAAKAATKSADPSRRFAGGREYPLTFNFPQSPSQVAAKLRTTLAESGVATPDSRFDLTASDPAASASDSVKTASMILRTDLDEAQAKTEFEKLAKSLERDANLLFERSENFSSTVASETQTYAIMATVASWVIIAAYLWLRFQSLTYGLAAIIAVIHDVLVTLGAVAATYWLATIPGLGTALLLDQFKIDLPMIAAFLTLIGFSVNDTIVIFDRIRENKGKSPHLTSQMINDAVNQTLSRTILTSFTAWLVVVILYIFGGEGLHGFAFSLVIGFLSGTYSTIYIASPILIDWIKEPAPAPATKTGKSLVTSS